MQGVHRSKDMQGLPADEEEFGAGIRLAEAGFMGEGIIEASTSPACVFRASGEHPKR